MKERPNGEHPRPDAGQSTGTAVWLLRHAQVSAEWQGRAYGGLDVPLSDDGELQSDALAEAFGHEPFAAVYSSPLARARRLGRALAAARGLDLAERPGLVEIERGSWRGLRVEELREQRADEVAGFYGDPWNFRDHGGESDADVLTRAWPVVAEALRDHAGGTVALACHYNVVRILVACALGTPPVQSFELKVEKAHGCLLLDAPGGWQLVHANVNVPAPPTP